MMHAIKSLMMRMVGMPSCSDVNRFLVDYLDGSLDVRTHRRFEKHLAHCRNCTTYLAQYRTTIDLVRSVSAPDVPAELAEHTIEFLRSRR